jgi:hypothetical protein
MAFIYGGDTGIADPQELQRRRAVIDALGQRAASNRPRSVGEGLNAIGESLFAVIGEKRLAKKEATARKQATDNFGRVTSALLGGMGYAAPSMAASMPGVTTPPVQSAPLTGNPAGLPQSIIDAVDRVDPQGGGALSPEQVKAGLVQRGLAPHVADGFVMNFGDESGFDPGINEIAPTVPGSRGGFGLAQWTGPRRVALEKFAAERGASVADPNVQMDFLMMELQGPEARAAQGIMSAPDANSAAQAIVRDFLRPAPENLDRRMAEYGGFSTPPAMAGGDPTAINQLAELSANPYLPEGQRAVVDALLQKQLAQIGQVDDPLRAIELQKAQLELEAMRSPTPEFTQLSPAEVASLGLPPGVYQRGPDGRIDTVEKTQGVVDPIADLNARAEAAGLVRGTPEYQQFMLNNGKTPDGMVIESDGQGGFRMVQGSGAGAAAAKPFTEGQSKDVVYATRAEGALKALEPVASKLTERGDTMSESVPFGLGSVFQDEDFQVARTAGNEFLQAILRKDTGAAITADEQSLYGGTYLPQPGDGPARLQYKSEARMRAIEAIKAGMSPAQIIAQERALEKGGATAPSGGTTYTYNPDTGELE